MPVTHAPPRSLPDISTAELAGWMTREGYNPVHAGRVLRKLLGVPVKTRQPLPDRLESRLADAFPTEAASLVMRQVSEDGTTKMLL
ncbi:MAG: 23S rRNA (adenine(2503)-C(2))-methyltransferase RlmN, partial [Verrucomicrobiaceae bacterium]|nr:23S rRNA (adenine(2503)-C(2))-methyltransferase RlmN [Verrucomicrobiaceae bacterium]